MTWPEAIVCIVAIISTLTYLGCTSWYWFSNEPEPDPFDEMRAHLTCAHVTGHDILNQPHPTRPSPARKPYW